MKFFLKKAIAGIITLCLIFAAAIPVDTAIAATSAKKTYSDVPGHKYEDALLYVIENGLMENSGSKIFPDSKLTKGAACLSLNNLLGATDLYDKMDEVGNLKKGEKYHTTVSIGLNCGYLRQKENGDVYSPLGYATYGYLSDIFSSVLGMDMKKTIIGKHNAADVLTRAEYAYLLQQLAPNIISKSLRDAAVKGDMYITKANLLLSNVEIDGNLIITDAVGDQNVTLNNVDITGKVVVRGGGENSVILYGKTTVPEMIVKQVNYNVSVKVNGSSFVKSLEVTKGSNNVELKGKIEEVKVSADSVKVSLTDAKVNDIRISGKGSNLDISSKTVVENVVIEESAAGTSLDVAGTVNELKVAAKNSEINVSEGKITAVKAEKTAENLSIEVSKTAVIDSVDSEADSTTISGDGTVSQAVLTGENSEVTTENTKVTDTSVTPVPTTAPSGGTGSGGSETTDYQALFDNQLKNSMDNVLSDYVEINAGSITNGNITLTIKEGKGTTAIALMTVSTITEVMKYVNGSNGKYKVTSMTYNGTTAQLNGKDDAAVLTIIKDLTSGKKTLSELKGTHAVTLKFTANNNAVYTKTYNITVN